MIVSLIFSPLWWQQCYQINHTGISAHVFVDLLPVVQHLACHVALRHRRHTTDVNVFCWKNWVIPLLRLTFSRPWVLLTQEQTPASVKPQPWSWPGEEPESSWPAGTASEQRQPFRTLSRWRAENKKKRFKETPSFSRRSWITSWSSPPSPPPLSLPTGDWEPAGGLYAAGSGQFEVCALLCWELPAVRAQTWSSDQQRWWAPHRLSPFRDASQQVFNHH